MTKSNIFTAIKNAYKDFNDNGKLHVCDNEWISFEFDRPYLFSIGYRDGKMTKTTMYSLQKSELLRIYNDLKNKKLL